ncbi:hypothetical protein TanjilG_09965 [Lupinus angustifolius]|uniref:HMA domain-containing protein n=1 Tax=Lupinus angustifolius TaxID=3871 RepID=A0A1J7FWK8_LUPAN|nr:PREDICTED: heavy metal-associated isoprenylated plant protein 6-like [Lupinus angustifolius]OIV92367.1 hypothetical protein TanjilG_09965 [Lupinus angustifolius]
MGEKKEQQKNETEKKPGGGDKKNDASASVVLKLELHCGGCVKKIKKAVRHFEGVEDVKADISASKLIVIGKVDPAQVRDNLAAKTKKKVDLVSPQPKKDAGTGGEKPPEKKAEEEKTVEKRTEAKTQKQRTVVLKTRLHCDGCIQKIRKIILNFKGAESLNIDGGKDLITVQGTMNVKDLLPYLSEKLKRNVEVIPPKKEKDKDKDIEGEKKVKKNKDKEIVGDNNKQNGKKEESAVKVEVNKMEHHGYGYGYGYPSAPIYAYPYGHGESSASTGYAMEVQPSGYDGNYHVDQGYNQQRYGYVEQPPMYMHTQNYPPPQMFSDENPNACSIM